ncbi:MAG: cytochrome c oxidase subunit 3 [Planctomycetota bacterium]
MATTEVSETDPVDEHGDGEQGHGDHDHHDHPSYLAHHFDTPEQQFDSGKLGMWLFLVTEVLFFSGMFCAYAIFRAWRPEVFVGCSEFLNTKLGAINTGILLFSSLTMAWAVRCSQLEEHKKLACLIATTLCCATMFLGVKAIEYSHKWEMGLLPGGMFTYHPDAPHADTNYLTYLCAPFAVATIGVAIWYVLSLVRGAPFQAEVAKPLIFVGLSFFGGVGLGIVLESGGEEHHDDSHIAAHDSHDGEGTDHANSDEHAEHAHSEQMDEEESAAIADLSPAGSMVNEDEDLAVIERLASDATNTGLQSELSARNAQAEMSTGAITYDVADDENATIASVEDDVLRPSRAGIFFSIYYCMTGVHAIHILAGIGVLIWLLVRAIRLDFNKNYFGPVDYVGLYWHLVDLIWIYLFPLMYLIR